MMRRRPKSTPFPYPRHVHSARDEEVGGIEPLARLRQQMLVKRHALSRETVEIRAFAFAAPAAHSLEPEAAVQPTVGGAVRSEEHTSELQSRQYRVCRLLLEK